ncbi:peptidase [Natrarchaeobius halalkaliphilus]|nr:peptidase [Natrarchaeobius halalkaliphilus]
MSPLIALALWIGLLVAVVVGSAIAAVVGYLFGRLSRRRRDETATRWTNVVTVGSATIAAISSWIVVDAASSVEPAFVPGPEIGSNLVAAIVAGVVAGIVGTAALSGILRARPDLPHVDDPAATRRQYARYLTVLFLGVFALVTLITPAIRAGPGALVVALAVLFVCLWALAPLISSVTSRTRRPTKRERDRLEELLASVDTGVRGVRIVDSGDGRLSLELSGAPRGRYLFVSEGALSNLEDGTLRAMLVARREQAARFERLVAVAPIFAALVVVIGMVLGDLSIVVGGPVAVVVVLGGFALARRLRYRSDARAAQRIGADELADAFERAAEAAGFDLAETPGRNWLATNPPLQTRIDRLRAENDRK